MSCSDVLDLVDAIAAGDLTPDAASAAHLASCPSCARALADAREIERLLQARPTPQPPAQFTARTLAGVRRARWQSEQFLDAWFNAALIVFVVSVVGGVWLLLDRSGLVAMDTVSRDAVDLVQTFFLATARRVVAELPLYAAATALVAGAVGIWWWAERGVTLWDE